MRASATAFKLERNGDDAYGEDVHLAGCLGDDGCRTGPGAAAHSGGDEDHAGLVADQFFDLFQRFNGGVAANIRKGTCALPPSEGSAELDFHRNRARVKGLGIGVAHDEIHALDAAVVHGVHRIRTAAAYADDFDRRGEGGVGVGSAHIVHLNSGSCGY